MAISFLDCTLRDGGCVNDFAFGTKAMREIKSSLESAGVKFIELGYIDDNKGYDEEYSMFSCEESITRQLLRNKNAEVSYFAMIDCGKYDVQNLPLCSEKTIDGIRLCFHKRQMDDAFVQARKILNKGYRLFIQPMINTRYTDEEMALLVGRINSELSEREAVYIVDSFGSMREEDFVSRCELVSSILNPNIKIGIHSHNNQNQSFDVISTIMTSDFNHDIFIDTTIAGIGKGAGNPDTYEVLNFYNNVFENRYNLDYIKKIEEDYIKPLQSVYPWGFNNEFFLCAKYKVTPSYLKFFKKQINCSEGDVELFLATIPEDKKDAFSSEFAESHLKDYMIIPREVTIDV